MNIIILVKLFSSKFCLNLIFFRATLLVIILFYFQDHYFLQQPEPYNNICSVSSLTLLLYDENPRYVKWVLEKIYVGILLNW